MKSIVRIAAIMACSLLALTALACGDDDEVDVPGTVATRGATTEAEGARSTPSSRDTTIQTSLGEFSITLDRQSVPGGDVTFRMKNDGTIPHELIVIETDLPADQLPQEAGIVDLDADGLDVIKKQGEFDPGQTKSLEADLDAGRYVLICNISGHYQLGMRTSLTVSGSQGGQ